MTTCDWGPPDPSEIHQSYLRVVRKKKRKNNEYWVVWTNEGAREDFPLLQKSTHPYLLLSLFTSSCPDCSPVRYIFDLIDRCYENPLMRPVYNSFKICSKHTRWSEDVTYCVSARASTCNSVILSFAEVTGSIVESKKFDELTHLLTRDGCIHRMEEILALGKGLTVGFADLHHLKEYNDQASHEVGDRAITTFTSHLREFAGHSEKVVLGRWGGDEFLIAHEGCGPTGRHFFTRELFPPLKRGIPFSAGPIFCCIGCAAIPAGCRSCTTRDPSNSHHESYIEPLINSDRAMYYLKYLESKDITSMCCLGADGKVYKVQDNGCCKFWETKSILDQKIERIIEEKRRRITDEKPEPHPGEISGL